MTKTQVEVITSVQRRRRWSRAEKERIVAAAIAPGAVASEVAREAGIHASQLFRWRQELCGPAPAEPVFSAVAIAPLTGAGPTPPQPNPLGSDRGGVCDRGTDADHRSGRCFDGQGDDCGAGED